MSKDINLTVLSGRLGRDPELYVSDQKRTVARLSLAVSRKIRARDDTFQYERVTDWFKVVCWEQLAVTCATYLKKGDKVCFTGRLQTQSYTDHQSGQTRKTTVLVASELVMLGSPNHSDASPISPATEVEIEANTEEINSLPVSAEVVEGAFTLELAEGETEAENEAAVTSADPLGYAAVEVAIATAPAQTQTDDPWEAPAPSQAQVVAPSHAQKLPASADRSSKNAASIVPPKGTPSQPPPTINLSQYRAIRHLLEEKGYSEQALATSLRHHYDCSLEELSYTQAEEVMSLLRHTTGAKPSPAQPQTQPLQTYGAETKPNLTVVRTSHSGKANQQANSTRETDQAHSTQPATSASVIPFPTHPKKTVATR
jgi:single-strand DNA-binding protein